MKTKKSQKAEKKTKFNPFHFLLIPFGVLISPMIAAIILVPLFLIGRNISDSINNDKGYLDSINQTKSISAEILEIKDGDEWGELWFISNFRVITIKLKITNTSNSQLTLNPDPNFKLKAGEMLETPKSSSPLSLNQQESAEVTLKYTVRKDLSPESLTLTDSEILEYVILEIDEEASYYSKNLDTQIVADEILDKEYRELRKQLQTYIADPTKLTAIKLDKALVSISLPKGATAAYEKTPSKALDYEYGDYYDANPDCYELDKELLTPASKEIFCSYYNIGYSLTSSTKLTQIGKSYKIYVDSYPKDHTGITNAQTEVNLTEIEIFGKKAQLQELVNTNQVSLLVTAKTTDGKVLVIVEDNYSSAYYESESAPEEIDNLEDELFVVILKSLKEY